MPATLQHVANLALPELADWCSVHVAGADGAIERVAIAHPDPEREAIARRLEEEYPTPPDATTGVPAVVGTGRSELYPEILDGLLEQSAQDDRHLGLLRALRLRSLVIVPMQARGRTVGAMAFASARAGRTYGTADLDLAEALGRRAGLAVENARLHRAEREAHRRLRQLLRVTDVALTHLDLDEMLGELLERLQQVVGSRSARVLLHDRDRGDLVVRAARGEGALDAVGARVARDRVPADGVPLRVGEEVVGILHVTTADPAGFAGPALDLLERENRLRHRRAGDPGPGEVARRPRAWPATRRRSSGRRREGARPRRRVGRPRRRGPVRAGGGTPGLRPGDTLLLYTDGLVERRGRLIDDRIAELAAAATAAPGDPEPFLDDLLATMTAGAHIADDVAAVAVRRGG